VVKWSLLYVLRSFTGIQTIFWSLYWHIWIYFNVSVIILHIQTLSSQPFWKNLLLHDYIVHIEIASFWRGNKVSQVSIFNDRDWLVERSFHSSMIRPNNECSSHHELLIKLLSIVFSVEFSLRLVSIFISASQQLLPVACFSYLIDCAWRGGTHNSREHVEKSGHSAQLKALHKKALHKKECEYNLFDMLSQYMMNSTAVSCCRTWNIRDMHPHWLSSSSRGLKACIYKRMNLRSVFDLPGGDRCSRRPETSLSKIGDVSEKPSPRQTKDPRLKWPKILEQVPSKKSEWVMKPLYPQSWIPSKSLPDF